MTRERQPKLAETVAQQIEDEIVARGWPVGLALGSEATLSAKYGVSRAITREAVRLLEQHMVVSPRRGAGGGLIVTRPDMSAVVPVVGVYLDSQGVTSDALLEARTAIEVSAVTLAATRITPDEQARLEAALKREEEELRDPRNYPHSHDVHILIAELSGNAALHLFVSVLTRLTSEHSRAQFATVNNADAVTKIGKDIIRAHKRIIEAIVKGDADMARQRMVSHLEAITPWVT